MDKGIIYIRFPDGRRRDVGVSMSCTAGDILPALVERVDTPALLTGAEAQEYDYCLLTTAGYLLSDDEPLVDAGVRAGDTLLLHREPVSRVWNRLDPHCFLEQLGAFCPYVPPRFRQ